MLTKVNANQASVFIGHDFGFCSIKTSKTKVVTHVRDEIEAASFTKASWVP